MITAPESNVTLPEKEQILIENVRREILIGEQKVKQLQGAERQLKGEIQADLNSKALIAAAIETLEVQKIEVEQKITTLESECVSLNADIEQAQKVFTDVSAQTKTKEDSLIERELNIKERESNFGQEVREHDLQVALLREEKQKHNEKVDKLLKALK